jgi:hypothetical protein
MTRHEELLMELFDTTATTAGELVRELIDHFHARDSEAGAKAAIDALCDLLTYDPVAQERFAPGLNVMLDTIRRRLMH